MEKENILIYGEGGCITGDAFIRYYIYTKDGKKQNDKAGTLAHLYARFNNLPRKGKGYYQREVSKDCDFYVNSFNEHNQVVRNKIINVVYSGIKPVYKLTLVNGKSLCLTEDHEVWTNRGFVALNELTNEDEVYFNPNVNNKKDFVTKRHRAEWFVKYHPSEKYKVVNGSTYCRLKVARAVLEAAHNGFNLDTYRDVLNTWKKEDILKLKTLSSDVSIHHLNGDYTDDSPENLAILTEEEHQKLHRILDNSNSCRNVYLDLAVIASIDFIGEQATYDIVCAEPYRNFIANEIAVHNSGKSASIATLFKFLNKFPDLKVRYLMTEANAMSGMVNGLKRLNIELKPDQLAYMVCRPNPVTSASSKQIADEYEANFLKLSEQDALRVKINAGDRAKRTAFVTILRGMATFKGTDYVTKEVKDYGDYLKWDSNHIFVVDSLTSCVDYLVAEVKATRVATVQSDYNHVQTNLMNKIIIPLTEQSQCSIIMLGHPVLGEDQTVRQPKEEENKIMKLYPRTFGQALNNAIVSKFSETIFSYVDRNDNFYWAGRKEGVATSPRKIPRQDKLEPDFSKYGLFE